VQGHLRLVFTGFAGFLQDSHDRPENSCKSTFYIFVDLLNLTSVLWLAAALPHEGHSTRLFHPSYEEQTT
jgi:hypothetical protein